MEWSARSGFGPRSRASSRVLGRGPCVTISSSVCAGIGCVVGLLTRVVETLDVELLDAGHSQTAQTKRQPPASSAGSTGEGCSASLRLGRPSRGLVGSERSEGSEDLRVVAGDAETASLRMRLTCRGGPGGLRVEREGNGGLPARCSILCAPTRAGQLSCAFESLRR